MIIVVMGVSGSGKTTVGRSLATRLGAAFVEGDDLHPSANLEELRSGVPLTDEDRALRAEAFVYLKGDVELIARRHCRRCLVAA